MEPNQLLNRLKDRDMVAYHYLTEQYGWKVYSYLQTRFQHKELVDEALNETFRQFYNTVAGSDDAIEALLVSFADRASQSMMQDQCAHTPAVQKKKKDGKVGTTLFVVALSGLIVGILCVLWVLIGLLMDLGIMPEVDLGYSWFSTNVFPWF